MLLPSVETPEPVAPFTGALLYPLAEILDLARGIVHNLERHHKILLRAAQDRQANPRAHSSPASQSEFSGRGDEEEEMIQLNNLVDIGLVLGAIDPIRWKEQLEEDRSYEWSEEELEALNHPRKAEEGLLGLSRVPRAEFVIQAAIERRKTKRGHSPPDDPYWRKEDALMNLLQFLSSWANAGLFVPS